MKLRSVLVFLSLLIWISDVFGQVNCPQNLPFTLMGNTEYCIGSTGSELYVPESYVGYEWLPTTLTDQNVLLTAGNYQLVVTHYTGCTDTLDFEVEQVSNPPQPVVTASGSTHFCQGESVTLSGPDGYPYYNWNSGSISHEITVFESGTFVLSITDWLGCTSSSNVLQVIVDPLPTAVFSANLNEWEIEFNNLSLDATDYEWNFGDGSVSMDFEPSYTYSTPGDVEMYLVASNSCGNDTAFLNLQSVEIDEEEVQNEILVYPNPTLGISFIEFESAKTDNLQYHVFDVEGKVVLTDSYPSHSGLNRIPLDLSSLPNGMYHLAVMSQNNIYRISLMLLQP